MNAREAKLRMMLLERHEQDWNGLEFLAWLLDLDGDIEEVVAEESERAFGLAEGHYQRVSRRVAVLHPRMIAQVGFLQGATFAAAALGREPFHE